MSNLGTAKYGPNITTNIILPCDTVLTTFPVYNILSHDSYRLNTTNMFVNTAKTISLKSPTALYPHMLTTALHILTTTSHYYLPWWYLFAIPKQQVKSIVLMVHILLYRNIQYSHNFAVQLQKITIYHSLYYYYNADQGKPNNIADRLSATAIDRLMPIIGGGPNTNEPKKRWYHA